MSQSLVNKLDFWLYRVATVLKSFKALYTLPQEKLDAFLDSYMAFDLDWVNPEQLEKELGADYVKRIREKVVNYYSVLTHLCAVGHVEKMYIPPAIDLSKNILQNQLLFERQMAKDLGVKKGARLFELGCGRGRIANHMGALTKAHITGINIDSEQLHAARKF